MPYIYKNAIIMRAFEFQSEIKNNQILIPSWMQKELLSTEAKNIRVIVLMDDSDNKDSLLFKKTAKDQFLEGYSESDAIYDNY